MKSKLVRDNIPTIIRKSGKTPITHVAGGEEAKSLTAEKLQEELDEFVEDNCVEEAADIYHAFLALIRAHDITYDQVIKAAVEKAGTHGRFDKMIILDEILDVRA